MGMDNLSKIIIGKPSREEASQGAGISAGFGYGSGSD
jgi:hypothetical protein